MNVENLNKTVIEKFNSLLNTSGPLKKSLKIK